MEYNKQIQIDYASRTIQNYIKLRNDAPYLITFQTTTLLAILSALFPEENLEMISYDAFVDLPYNTISNREYFSCLRNSLAHKTILNFRDLTRNGIINEIHFKSRAGNIIRLSENDIDDLINNIQDVIKEIFDFI